MGTDEKETDGYVTLDGKPFKGKVYKPDDWYRQCKLQHESEYQVAWIPTKFAKKNQLLTLESDEHKKKWKVIELYNRLGLHHVEELERDHLHQRKASDI